MIRKIIIEMAGRYYNNLQGVNILITGAASGIGKLLAQELFLRERSNLLLADIDFKKLQTVSDELNKQRTGGSVKIYEVDISSATSVASFVGQLKDIPVDILINNAGIVSVGAFEKKDFSELERVMDVNLVGTIRFTHALLPIILRSAKPSVITITSAAGYVAAPGLAAYSASKFGLTGFMDSLRTELKGRAQVCTISPGFIRTDLAKNAPKADSDEVKQKMDSFLQERGDDPATVVSAVIKAIKYNRKRVLVNGQAYFLYYLNKCFPWLSDLLIDYLYKRFKKEGIVKE